MRSKVILITWVISVLTATAAIGQRNDLERRVSFAANNKTIVEVLAKITEASHVKFSYSKEELPSTNVTLTINNETVADVLDKLFENTGLEYRFLSDMVAIRKTRQASAFDSQLSLSGTVIDAEDNTPLAFASIGVLKKAKGTITNISGSFMLRLPADFRSDTLLISMMGYHSVKIPIAPGRGEMIIKMKPEPVILKEVEVASEKIKVEEIFKQIRSRIKLNYPVEDYAMECFYREIKKENDMYRSLLEAALVIRDRGYDQPRSHESAYVREIRGSSKFVNRFSSFWQENNLLKETLGLNAVRHPSSTPNVFGDDVYQLHGVGVMNDKEVYVLVSNINENDCWQRTIYVDVDTYAIYRSEEVIRNFGLSWKVEDSDSVHLRLTKGTSVFDFKTYDSKLFLSHIRHEVENEYFNPLTDRVLQRFTIINDLLVTDIYENPDGETDSLKKVENHSLELQVTPYNEAFWKQYNAIEQTPIEKDVMKDLLMNGELRDQFVKTSQKNGNGKKARNKKRFDR
jgi:hypothetical protein